MVNTLNPSEKPLTQATLEVKYDPELNDYFLEIPPDMLASLGWAEGDTLVWTQIGNKTWSLSKKSSEPGPTT